MKFRNRCAIASLAIMSVLSTSSVIPSYGAENITTLCDCYKSWMKNPSTENVNSKIITSENLTKKVFEVHSFGIAPSVRVSLKVLKSMEKKQIDEFEKAMNVLNASSASINSLQRKERLDKMDNLVINLTNFLYLVALKHDAWAELNPKNYDNADLDKFRPFSDLFVLSDNSEPSLVDRHRALYSLYDAPKSLISGNFKKSLKKFLADRTLIKKGTPRFVRRAISFLTGI